MIYEMIIVNKVILGMISLLTISVNANLDTKQGDRSRGTVPICEKKDGAVSLHPSMFLWQKQTRLARSDDLSRVMTVMIWGKSP